MATYIILDGIVVVVFILAVAWAIHRGFVESLIHFIGFIAAFALAIYLSTACAGFVFDTFIHDGVQLRIVNSMESVQSQTKTDAGSAIKALPQTVTNAIEYLGYSPEAVLEKVNQKADTTTENIAATIVNEVVRPVAVTLLRFLFVLILTAVGLILVRILARVLGNVCKLPVLRQMNKTLGALVGICKGAVLVFIVVTVFQLLAITGGSKALITSTAIDHTVIVKWVAANNPIIRTIQHII